MNRLLPVACLILMLAPRAPAHAAGANAECAVPLLATLGRELKVARFVPGPEDFGTDPAGVVIASSCRQLPQDPRMTLAAVAWNAGKEDQKSLAIAIVDESASVVVALRRDEIDEDAATRIGNGSLRLDTAPYDLAEGVRAFGLDIFSEDRSCGEGGFGPSRTLYVREGRTLRPVLEGLSTSQYRYLRGNRPRCAGNPKEAESAILEDDAVTISLGAAGKGGWRDLVLTVTSRRSDHEPGRKPLHVRVPGDGGAYPLAAFTRAYEQWRK
jgi:hypothetical protein